MNIYIYIYIIEFWLIGELIIVGSKLCLAPLHEALCVFNVVKMLWYKWDRGTMDQVDIINLKNH